MYIGKLNLYKLTQTYRITQLQCHNGDIELFFLQLQVQETGSLMSWLLLIRLACRFEIHVDL